MAPRKKSLACRTGISTGSETYTFKEPMKLPAGTRIDLVATTIIRRTIRAIPRIRRALSHGASKPLTEMCLAFLLYTPDGEQLTQGKSVGRLPGDFGGGDAVKRPALTGSNLAPFCNKCSSNLTKTATANSAPLNVRKRGNTGSKLLVAQKRIEIE